MRNLRCLLLLCLGLVFHLAAETFRNPRHIPIPSNPQQVGTADFNGDGRPDFYYADASGLNVILANSDGSYAAPQTTAIGAATPTGAPPPFAGGCWAADFNGDGFADAVCFTPETATTPSASIFIGNGDGTLRADSTLSVPNKFIFQGSEFFFLAFADINSDGHVDIVFYSSSGTIFTAFGNGSGQFENVVPSQLSFADPSWIKGATVADINGDGHPDIVFIDDPMVMLGLGDGTFTEANNNLLVGTDCHLGDFDKDGHLDLVCARLVTSSQGSLLTYSLEIHHGNPNGTFTITPSSSKSYSSADFISPFAARDLNGDGYLDVLALSADGLVIFFGKPGLQFSPPVHYAFYNAESFDEDQGDPSLIADYNLDGNLDLAMPGVNGIYITYGRKDGTFDAPPVIRFGSTTGDTVVGDFNEDGTPDLLTSGTTGLQLSLGKGNGIFTSPVTVHTSPLSRQAYLGSFAAVYSGDFNGDHHTDVIALQLAESENIIPLLFPGRGDGTFRDPITVTNVSPGFPYVVADVNGDGRDDLVCITADAVPLTGVLNVLLSQGGGTFDLITTALPLDGNYNGALPAAADFNGDGKVDIVVAGPQAIQILLGNGDGTFDSKLPALPVPSFNNPQYGCCGEVITGDFDHDGNADFAFLRSTPGSTLGPTAIVLYYGHGDGTFSQAITAASLDRNYAHLIAADLNGDGLSDFVLSTTEGNDYRGTAISIVHSLPGHKFSGETNLVAGAGFSAMAVADFTRDGLPDLLFTNGSYADSLVLLTSTGSPSVTLTSSADPSLIGQTVTFTATIRAPGDVTVLPHPATITFEGLPGGNVTAPITFAGGSGKPFTATATYETADLPVGSTVITASYPGDTLLNPASGSLTQVVNSPPTYQLVASPTALTVKAGATTNNTVAITVRSLYAFAGNVSLSCRVTYAGSGTATNPPTCAFGNNPLPVNGSDVSTQLILSTTAASSAARRIAGSRNLDPTGIVLWAGAFLLLLPAGLRYRWPAVVMVLVLAVSMQSLVGCGGTGTSSLAPPTNPQPPTSPAPPSGPSGTQAGSYTVTVSATSDTAATAPSPLTIQLTVN